MTLKSRFFLVTVTTTFAVALAVIAANQLTHHMHESRYLETAIETKRSLWSNILNNELDIMQAQIYSVTRDAQLRAALLKPSPSAALAAVHDTFTRLSGLQYISKLQVADRNGALVAAYPDDYVGTTAKSMVDVVIRESRPVRGIDRDDDGELLAMVAFPLYTKPGKLLGVGILARNLVGVLQRFMERDASLAFIADRGDVIGLPVESNILPDVTREMPNLGQDVHSVEYLHGRAYQVTILSLGDYRGHPVAHMVSFKDFTENYVGERAANLTTYTVIILMLVASALWLYWFVVIESSRLHEFERRNNQQLALANNRLQEALRVKSDFLANMSHELRTPLNSVIGFSGALLKGLDGALNGEQRSSVQYVYNSGQHLLNLINDVLDISKIEAGKMVLSLEAVDLRALVDETAKSVAVLFRNKNLPLRLDIAESVPIVYGDDTRIKQVLLNILSNAAKFTDKGEVRVACTLIAVNDAMLPTTIRAPSEGQTHWVLIAISDTGIGIRREDMDKVFEEFRQLDSGSARKYSGTGLGMAISRRIVEMHGGDIWLTSQPGVGTTFYVILPHALQAQVTPAEGGSDVSPAGPQAMDVVADRQSQRVVGA
jgi:signal transduction histidine kinase